ncbi:hypothetical protein CCHOA_01270 [Corynebacterium choanae]|uniref:Uncharacterized protein n=1 Tax=Corynebacterium choanae TaxID=1862358 RepID=A0A3G6J446_9CORY|nr:hypothetical protein CCHOA_01270 [Corynebacterium choanae]
MYLSTGSSYGLLKTDAHTLTGNPLAQWITNGFEVGKWGVSTQEALTFEGDTHQEFQGGISTPGNREFDKQLIHLDGNMVYKGDVDFLDNCNNLENRFQPLRTGRSFKERQGAFDFESSVKIPSTYPPAEEVKESLKDFCTSSPDLFPLGRQPLVRLDLRGSCARHNTCHYESDRKLASIEA